MSDSLQHKGFTLIELLLVMAVIALLLTIAVPRYFGSLEKSKQVALQENLKVMRTTLGQFYADKGYYPATLDVLVEQQYLKAVPLDPITESSTTWVLSTSRDPGVKGIVDVRSGAPGVTRDGRAYADF